MYESEWTDIFCPNCQYYMVAVDKIGYRCFVCGWEKEHGGIEFFPPRKPTIEIIMEGI